MDPDVINEQQGFALHMACARKHEGRHANLASFRLDCAHINGSSKKSKELLQKFPDMNVNAQAGVFGTALRAAAYCDQILSVRLWLDRGAKVNTQMNFGSALNRAIVSGHETIVKNLFDAGAARLSFAIAT
ncbi:uncharacterized protein TrAtP1_009741 [Trichoderma atroviride]|uniref:Ankyrin repeat protein n=1 Tax=Hypocrea atroviridis (strain ATCC 20476 / IMI 206040) TaxID=452589 RepID=G9NKS8_HYPAI|nr:uncharacterized protein TRIATDRAFT_305319 [Trichoderma atroviride IMI 206040]EHK48500.1 hypothetical protein TRIATDRAFT_305319 [Trichoderma atroviride IMI 206040]UKZ68718.1 hypothetical protein TrAtP1_009741 [Trichoderma atroviride]